MNELRTYVSLAQDLRSGKMTPRAYLEECLDRIAKNDPRIGAFVTVNADGARKAADAASARWKDGKPLSAIDGMPIAVKDVIETADMPTGQGSPMWEGNATRRDSAAVRALREAGGVILGKTTTTEFAATHPWHKTQNPHDGTRTPGGSSSGSAAAVGAGMVPAALGTQVVGSILRPASFCGCVGYKPSVGGVNRSGSYDHFSQSCQGAIGATVADVWGAHHHGHGPHRRRSRPHRRNRHSRASPRRVSRSASPSWKPAAGTPPPRARARRSKARRKSSKPPASRSSRAPMTRIWKQLRSNSSTRFPLTQAINAFEGRWPLNTYAALDEGKLSQPAKDRLKTANAMTQKRLRRTAQAAATPRARPIPKRRASTMRSSRSAPAAPRPRALARPATRS